MTLTFHTPSRNCPARHLNGSTVTIRAIGPRVKVKRCGGWVRRYTVANVEKTAIWTAYPDELHIEGGETWTTSSAGGSP